VGNARSHADGTDDRRPDNGHKAAKAAARPHSPLRSRQPIRRCRLPQGSQRSPDDPIHEPERKLLRQRADGKLLRHFENGTRAPGLLRNPGCCLIQCPQNRGKVTLTGAGGVSNVATATISVIASVAARRRLASPMMKVTPGAMRTLHHIPILGSKLRLLLTLPPNNLRLRRWL
jgi:hypothetical protein